MVKKLAKRTGVLGVLASIFLGGPSPTKAQEVVQTGLHTDSAQVQVVDSSKIGAKVDSAKASAYDASLKHYHEDVLYDVNDVFAVTKKLSDKKTMIEGLKYLHQHKKGIIRGLIAMDPEHMERTHAYVDAKTQAFLRTQEKNMHNAYEIVAKHMVYYAEEGKIMLTNYDFSYLDIPADYLTDIHLIGCNLSHARVKGKALAHFATTSTDLTNTVFPKEQVGCDFNITTPKGNVKTVHIYPSPESFGGTAVSVSK